MVGKKLRSRMLIVENGNEAKRSRKGGAGDSLNRKVDWLLGFLFLAFLVSEILGSWF